MTRRDARIFIMRKRGYPLREIGAAVGCSHETVRNILQRTGLFLSRVPLRKKLNIDRGCDIRGCVRKHCGRGYCGPHLVRIRAGTMDRKGNPLLLRRTCRICGKGFNVLPRSATRKMCDKCRPPVVRDGSHFKESAMRRKRVSSLRKRGISTASIARMIGRSPWTVWTMLRQRKRGTSRLKQARRKAGLCAKCGDKRNKFAAYCDNCHEKVMVSQRNRLRLRFKQTPRCNAIGCRMRPANRGFCRDCYAAWRRGKIDSEGKHVLSICPRCSCKFIPDREGQGHCRACERKS